VSGNVKCESRLADLVIASSFNDGGFGRNCFDDLYFASTGRFSCGNTLTTTTTYYVGELF